MAQEIYIDEETATLISRAALPGESLGETLSRLLHSFAAEGVNTATEMSA